MQSLVAARETCTAARLLALGLVFCTGCGAELSVAPVSGTITLDGAPLAGATITTQPIGGDSQSPGSGSFGRTDDEGRFDLELVKPAVRGAIIGEHRVMISPAAGDPAGTETAPAAEGERWTDDPRAHRAAAAGNKWPARFTDGSLRMSVPPEGDADIRFDLKR